MTVKELREALTDYPDDLEVYMDTPNGLNPKGWSVERVTECEKTPTHRWVALA